MRLIAECISVGVRVSKGRGKKAPVGTVTKFRCGYTLADVRFPNGTRTLPVTELRVAS